MQSHANITIYVQIDRIFGCALTIVKLIKQAKEHIYGEDDVSTTKRTPTTTNKINNNNGE